MAVRPTSHGHTPFLSHPLLRLQCKADIICTCQVVVKSQILAGGRGLGTFKNGFKGGVHIVKADQAEETARKMLGQTLVTKQTGPGGKPVGTLLIANKMDLTREMYFAILNDRGSAQVMMIGCGEGAQFSLFFLERY